MKAKRSIIIVTVALIVLLAIWITYLFASMSGEWGRNNHKAAYNIYAYHGAKDELVLPYESINMANRINRHGGSAQIKILPDAGHGGWGVAYASDELLEWMLVQKRTVQKRDSEA